MGKAAEIMASLTSGDVSRHSSRHYGTVTAIDTAHDKVTVLLDGASEPTVCDSRDVKVYDNDRVEVEIRDHKAIIKANAKHQVTDDGVALDALDQAAIARGAAEDAVDDAAAAQRAATEAAASAASAEGSASTAANAATNAQASAGSAATAATNAQTSAGNAASSASAAQTSAGQAQSSAATAASAAQQASADASIAAGAASAAQADAATAKRAADRSLVQLSIVEDVSGTLNWIAEHGSYEATTDTSVVDGKVYFELVSGDYVPIAQPTGNPQQQGWYILDITDSQTEYIMAHIAVTSRGLWVLPSGIGSETTPDTGETQADSDARQGDGYKVLLSSRGMTVYDNYGDDVATYGESTTFASDRDWYVGSSNAFIFYDASENAIQIGGANVTIGGLTPGQLAGSQIWTATADPTTPNYTFAISNLTGPSGVSPRVGDLVVRSYYRYTISSVSTTTVLTGNRTSIRGGTGAAGSSVTVSSVEYAYQLSTSGTTVPTGTWGSTPVAPTATQYAWTRTTTTYSDNTTAVTYTVGGKGGADGSPGTSVTISSKSVKYQASTSGTTTPTGTWLDSVPTVAQGSYLWTRTVVTYSTGDSTTAYSVARMGSDGQTGAAGPEAVVSISVTAVDFSVGTATLSASLRVNGTVTTPTSYKWTSGTSTQQIGTNEQTLSVSGTGALNATYNCTVTWSGGTQTGSIDLAATSAVKTYAAATFATQSTVSTMQSEIETNAGQIALRATKTEAYQLSQPNLSPYFSSSPYNRTANSYWYGMGVNSNYTFTDMGDGWMRVQCTNSGSSVIRVDWYPIKCPSVVAGQPYTWLAEVRNNASTSASSGSDFYLVQNNNCQFWGQKATETIEGPGGTSMSINIGTCGSSYVLQKVQNAETASDGHWTNNDEASVVGLACWTFRCAANSSIDYEVRLSLYEGRYAGPYKPYSGTQLYASQAELKVANDEIDARVEKDGVIAAINVSPETGVTIDADRVNINGAAIFTSGRLSESSLNNAYDAKGAASAVQTNLDNLQVGGRNLFAKSQTLESNYWTLEQGATLSNGIVTLAANNSSRMYQLPANGYWAWEPNTEYVVSVDAKASAAGGKMTFNMVGAGSGKTKLVDLSTSWARYSWAFTSDATVSTGSASFYNSTTSGTVQVRFPKLEKGTKSTDWTPAPEDQMTATQRVYYRSATAASVAAPSTWVTANGNVWSQWTTKVPRLTQNADGSGTKYPYLYTCEQHRMGDGSIVCTAVLLDENTTVIDGGSIITNSITANKLQANSLTLGYINQNDAETAAALLNSSVQVGGRNLLLWTGEGETYNDHQGTQRLWNYTTIYGSLTVNGNTALFTKNADGLTNNTSGLRVMSLTSSGTSASSSAGNSTQYNIGFKVGEQYTFSCDAKTSGNRIALAVQYYNGSTVWASTTIAEHVPLDTSWHRYTYTFTIPSGFVCVTALGIYCQLANGVTLELKNVKLERGNRATDYSPAPEDQTAYVDAVQVGGRNLMQKSLLVWQGSNNTTLDTSAYVSSGTIVCSRTASTNGGFYITQYTLMEPDTEYVVSFKAKCTSGSVTTLYVHGASPENHVVASAEVYAGGTLLGGFNTSLSVTLSSSSYTSFVLKFKTKATISTGSYLGHIIQWNKSASTAYTVEMAEFKFEKGNRPTDWTPAPEDQTTYVDTSLAESVGSITTTIDTEVDTLTDSITGVSNSLASLGGKVDGLVQKAAALEKKTQWVKWDDTEGMIFGENGTAFNTRLKAENMTFNYGNQTMMTLSATGGVDAPKVRTQRLELGSDWAITISGDMFAIDYIGS